MIETHRRAARIGWGRRAGQLSCAAAIGVVGFFAACSLDTEKLSDLETACPNNQCPADKTSERHSIESLETTTNVLLIGGAIIAATGVVLVLVGKPSVETASSPTRAYVKLVPSLGGIVATGAF